MYVSHPLQLIVLLGILPGILNTALCREFIDLRLVASMYRGAEWTLYVDEIGFCASSIEKVDITRKPEEAYRCWNFFVISSFSCFGSLLRIDSIKSSPPVERRILDQAQARGTPRSISEVRAET